MGACVSCVDSQCYLCALDSSVCTSCKDGYGLLSGSCATCTDSQCLTCSTNASSCNSCGPGYGVSGSICSLCADTNCVTCSTDNTNCTGCVPGYGPASGMCQPCADSNCRLCPDPASCIECSVDYGLTVSNSCSLCNSSCLDCSRFSWSTCVSCFTSFYLNAGMCLPCISNC